MPPRRTDQTARTMLLAIAAGRVAIGIGALAATSPALRMLGFSDPGPAAVALAKLAGGRDVALGLLALLARDEPGALRTAGLAAAGVDAADALSLGLAALREEGLGQAGVLGALSGGGAALGGLWASARLD